ncbi:MAG: amidohydrolase [Planctomycetota bacterium]
MIRPFHRERLMMLRVCMCVVLCCASWSAGHAQEADVVYSGGEILTMRGETPEYIEVLAIRDGRILFAGTRSEGASHIGPGTQMVDLAGRTLLPGFIDGHGHLLTHADSYLQAPLSPPPIGRVESIGDIIRELRQLQDRLQSGSGEWLIGSGYDQDFLRERRHPTAADLDTAFPENPVVLLHASGHMLVANSAAFRAAGIDSRTPDPEGGTILRKEGTREPEGLVQEMGMAAFANYTNPQRPLDVELDLIRRAVEHYASLGITTAAEHLVMPQKMAVIQEAAEKGLFKIDVAATPAFLIAREVVENKEFPWRKDQHGLKFVGLKVAVDGSPQGKTAFLSKPYLTPVPGCSVDCRGFSNVTQKDLNTLFLLTYRNGVQMYAHCNGDAAIDMVLEAHRVAMADLGQPAYDHRTVVVHSQIVRPEQLDAYVETGLYPTFFTNHVFYWGETHRTNLGEDRAAFISPLKTARAKGIRFSNHTDNPVTPVDPLFLLWTSVNRITRSGKVLGPEERVSSWDGLRALTSDAAYEYFEESSKGTLEAGKLADLVILDANPVNVLPEKIREIRVLETIKAGQSVYQRSSDR